MSDKTKIGNMSEYNQAELIGDTSDPEYIVRYNLFDAGEPVGGFVIQTGHANITLIERSDAGDAVIGGGNIGVNLGGVGADNSDEYSHINPFSDNKDGILGVDAPSWNQPGKAIYEQTVTPEQFQDVQDYITSYTGDLNSTVNVNYNVGASVLPLEDQHSCYSFTQDIFEVTGGKGRLIEQFSESELEKVDNLIETVHGDIPAIPGIVSQKANDLANDAAEAVSNTVESGIEKVRDRTGFGSAGEDGTDQDASQEAPLVPTSAPVDDSNNLHGPEGVWQTLFGRDETGALEQAIEQAGSTPPFVPYGQVVQQFSDDRESLRISDPEATQLVTQAANHPDAEAMFVRLSKDG
ncbi:MAG: hypothetical protein ABJG88_11030, partial [Litorimonas sp.]